MRSNNARAFLFDWLVVLRLQAVKWGNEGSMRGWVIKLISTRDREIVGWCVLSIAAAYLQSGFDTLELQR